MFLFSSCILVQLDFYLSSFLLFYDSTGYLNFWNIPKHLRIKYKKNTRIANNVPLSTTQKNLHWPNNPQLPTKQLSKKAQKLRKQRMVPKPSKIRQMDKNTRQTKPLQNIRRHHRRQKTNQNTNQNRRLNCLDKSFLPRHDKPTTLRAL
jgi:hypothetical protein